VRESEKLGDVWFRNRLRVSTLDVARSLDVSLPESGTRSYIVNVLLNVGGHVIGFSRNVVRS
jgi:hypothetical protein